MKHKTMDNRGISLIEIIVAIAVGSIVLAALSLLIIRGMNSYREQTANAALQSDANIALNQISDNIMEATCLEISNDNTGRTLYVKLKEGEPSTEEGENGKDGVCFVYDSDKEILYQSSQPASKDAVLCERVKEFKVRILKNSLLMDEGENNVNGVDNPIQLRIDIKLEGMDVEREVNRTVAMRNSMKQITLFVDESTSRDVSGSVPIAVEELGRYIYP